MTKPADPPTDTELVHEIDAMDLKEWESGQRTPQVADAKLDALVKQTVAAPPPPPTSSRKTAALPHVLVKPAKTPPVGMPSLVKRVTPVAGLPHAPTPDHRPELVSGVPIAQAEIKTAPGGTRRPTPSSGIPVSRADVATPPSGTPTPPSRSQRPTTPATGTPVKAKRATPGAGTPLRIPPKVNAPAVDDTEGWSLPEPVPVIVKATEPTPHTMPLPVLARQPEKPAPVVHVPPLEPPKPAAAPVVLPEPAPIAIAPKREPEPPIAPPPIVQEARPLPVPELPEFSAPDFDARARNRRFESTDSHRALRSRLPLVIGIGALGAMLVLVTIVLVRRGGGSDSPATTASTDKPAPSRPPPVEKPPEPPIQTPPEPPETPPTPTPPEPPPTTATETTDVATAPTNPGQPKLPVNPKIKKPGIVEAPIAPETTPPADNLGKVRAAYATGNQRLFAGDTEGAIRAYREVITLSPGYAAGYRGLGLAYAQRGDRANALQALRTYVRAAPTAKDVDLIKQRIALLE